MKKCVAYVFIDIDMGESELITLNASDRACTANRSIVSYGRDRPMNMHMCSYYVLDLCE